MHLSIPDEVLKQAGVSEHEMAVELACRLFEIGFLDLWPAAQLAGLSRVDMETELASRGIAIYRYTPEEYEKDLDALKRIWG